MTVTNAPVPSPLFAHPAPTPNAPVGTFPVASVIGEPVFVNVGKSEIWFAVNEGPNDVGGQIE